MGCTSSEIGQVGRWLVALPHARGRPLLAARRPLRRTVRGMEPITNIWGHTQITKSMTVGQGNKSAAPETQILN
jgi:hypothetical protein